MTPLNKFLPNIQSVIRIFDQHVLSLIGLIDIDNKYISLCIPDQLDETVPTKIRFGLFLKKVGDLITYCNFSEDFVLQYAQNSYLGKNLTPTYFQNTQIFLIHLCKSCPDILLKLNYYPDRLDVFVFILYYSQKNSAVLQYLPDALASKTLIPADDLVHYTFTVHDNSPVKVSEFVPLLNRVDLNEKSRKLIWKLIINNQLSFNDFISQYDFKGDDLNLLEYALIMNEKEIIIDSSQKSIEAFGMAFQWLEKYAESELYTFEFSNIILSYQESSHFVIEYINKFARRLSGEEDKIALLAPVSKRLLYQIMLLNEILEDPVENGLTKEDFLQLLGGLNLFAYLEFGLSENLQYFCKLKNLVDNVHIQEILKLDSLQTISELLEKCIKL